MIDINNVSMRFNLGIEKNFSFKMAFIGIFDKSKRPKKRGNLRACVIGWR